MPRPWKPPPSGTYKMTDEHRGRLKTVSLLNALQEHALGKRDLSATQVQAITVLLRKVMPDLAQMELHGDMTVRNVVSPEMLTPEQWLERHGEPKRLNS